MHHTIRLSNRLQAIAGLIERGAKVADIGTDHGYLPVYLAQESLACSIIASDISAGALEAAHRSTEKYGVTEKAKLVHAPGLEGVNEEDVDTIVIAGVGGETIVGILEEAPWAKNCKRLILQPQTKMDVLYSYLNKKGYAIKFSKAIRDKGRNYLVIVAYGEGD